VVAENKHIASDDFGAIVVFPPIIFPAPGLQTTLNIDTQIFGKTTDQAIELTKQIHEQGKGIVGTYLHEIAEQKGIETTLLARQEGYPLQVKIQKHS